jgi:hypothetical protein
MEPRPPLESLMASSRRYRLAGYQPSWRAEAGAAIEKSAAGEITPAGGI